MIAAIGLDAVSIARFSRFYTYSFKQLSRIYTVNEYTYCTSNTAKSAERFAARFAAKEAFYKAYCQAPQVQQQPFITLAPQIEIIHGLAGRPQIALKESLALLHHHYTIHCSLTHSTHDAIAVIILEYPQNNSY